MDKLGKTIKDIRPWFKKDTLFNEINVKSREYFINIVQAPLVNKIVKLACKYPEPKREKLIKPNSLAFLDIFDDMLQYERNARIKSLMEAAKRVLIGKNESCNHYSERIDVFTEKLVEKYNSGEIRKRRPWTPSQYWDEPSVLEFRRQRIKELMAGIEEKTGEN